MQTSNFITSSVESISLAITMLTVSKRDVNVDLGSTWNLIKGKWRHLAPEIEGVVECLPKRNKDHVYI